MTAVADAPLVGAVEPRICVHPDSGRSAGAMAVKLARRAGLKLDPWQALVLERALGVEADGRWSAFEAAVIVARQNGKSAIFEARMLAGLFLFEERLILYSAHEFKTAGEIFRRVLALIEGTPDLRKRVKAVARSKGEEGIELVTGQRLRFVARSTNSGRGFSADCTIWDECQNLPDASVDAMMPTLLARPNAQLWYGGSAGDQELAPCGQIGRVRERALAGGEQVGKLAYFEWSADLCGDMCPHGCDRHDDPGDPVTWAACNPALGSGRVTVEGIAKMHDSMSPRGFARELLSVGNYPVASGGWEVIREQAWRELAAPDADRPDGPVAFAVDVTPDRAAAAIAVCGKSPDGRLLVEISDHRRGTGWVVGRVLEMVARWEPCAVVVDGAGPAGSLIAELEAAGVEVQRPSARDVAQACGAFYDAAVPAAGEPTLRHLGQEALDAAVAGAARRQLGDAWAWSRRSAVDISPLVAVTLAAWGHATHAHLAHGAPSIYY